MQTPIEKKIATPLQQRTTKSTRLLYNINTRALATILDRARVDAGTAKFHNNTTDNKYSFLSIACRIYTREQPDASLSPTVSRAQSLIRRRIKLPVTMATLDTRVECRRRSLISNDVIAYDGDGRRQRTVHDTVLH